jgi:hypothetical protein
MHTAENHVIMGFQDILQFLIEKSDTGVETAKSFMGTSLKNFGTALTGGFEKKLAEIRQHLMDIDETKMDRTEKANIQGTIDAFKEHIIELQKKQIASLKTVTVQQFEYLSTKVNETLQDVNPETLAERVQQRVMENVDLKFKNHLKDFEAANKGILSQENKGNISEKIAQAVKDELQAHLTPDALKSIISTLPEYQAIQSLHPEQAPLSETVRKIIADLNQEVNDLKIQGFSTRALLNNLIDKNLTPTDVEVMNAHQAAAINHMEELQKNIQLMHNNIKIIETVMTVKAKAIEESATASSNSTVMSRKRPRTEDDLDLIDSSNEYSNKTVIKRVDEMETKHQKLLDFILQCKDTVLDETFPTKLEAAFKKIEDKIL